MFDINQIYHYPRNRACELTEGNVLLQLEIDFMVRFVLFALNLMVALFGVLLARRTQNYYIDREIIKNNTK